MNVLDENIPLAQRHLLELRGFRVRSIGQEIARFSIGDDDIICVLHRLKHPTFFTRDEHFFKRRLCHAHYGLAWIDAPPAESAFLIRRYLKHLSFDTNAKRMGIVARLHHTQVHFWNLKTPKLLGIPWEPAEAL